MIRSPSSFITFHWIIPSDAMNMFQFQSLSQYTGTLRGSLEAMESIARSRPASSRDSMSGRDSGANPERDITGSIWDMSMMRLR